MKQRKSKNKNKKMQRRRNSKLHPEKVTDNLQDAQFDTLHDKYPISDLEMSMGTTKYLPKMEDCKADKRYSEIAAHLLFKGCNGCPPELRPKEGIAPNGSIYIINWKAAMYIVFAHLRSFDPSHEHKMLGCGELLSKFFDLKD